jgi:hypothetical protein
MKRFWDKVDIGSPDSCWLWTAGGHPYGAFRFSTNRMEGSHRAAYMIANNVYTIPDGMYVCHTCDTPRCCNPDHLFLGTPSDNRKDMLSKGRQNKDPNVNQTGASNNGSKLNDEIVREIKTLYSQGLSQREVARRTGIPYANVWNVVNNKTWSHVTIDRGII